MDSADSGAIGQSAFRRTNLFSDGWTAHVQLSNSWTVYVQLSDDFTVYVQLSNDWTVDV